jgi:predicted HTH transcriptional regulator
MNDKRRLQELISEGEHQQQDFKYKIQDAAKLARTVSAFANTDGGRLLIGVRDDGVIAGVRSDEEIYMMEKAARLCCRPASAISFETLHADGHPVVIATVPSSAVRPVRAVDDDGRPVAYVRVKDENIVATPVHLEMWKQDRASTVVTVYGDDETLLLDTLGAHPDATLNRLVRLSGFNRRHVVRMLARFVRYDLVEMYYQDPKFYFRLK